ncbi:MAG: HEAT repeat domain-containing protein [Candidatus Margulisiibacteriota bacterium]
MGMDKLTRVDQWFVNRKMHQWLPNTGLKRRINVGLAGIAGALLPRLGMDSLRQHYLGILNQVTATPTLQVLSEKYPGVLLDARKDAIKALGTIGNQTAVTALVTIFTNREEDFNLRRDAAWALGRIGGKEATGALQNELFITYSMQFGGWESVGDALAHIAHDPADRAGYEGFVHASRLIASYTGGGNTAKRGAAEAAILTLGMPAAVALKMIIELRYPLSEVIEAAQILHSAITGKRYTPQSN